MWFPYALIAAWLVVHAGALWFGWLFQRGLGSPVATETEPPVTIVAPVKGDGPLLRPFLACLRTLDYSDYRILAVVESETDPAAAILCAEAGRPGAPLRVCVAGLAETEGQKVHNLRHALGELDAVTAIVAFIDADTLPRPDWLARLVRPLEREPEIAAVTGYRWIVPEGRDLPSAIVAAANCSLVSLPRPWPICWGGTLALRRASVDRLDLRGTLAGAVVDDVHLTRILAEAGLRVLTPRGLILLSPVRHDWSSAFAFARRQYVLVRWYLPLSWAVALVLTTLPLLAASLALALAAGGDRVAVAALAAAVLMGQLRVVVRGRIAEELWGEEGRRLYDRHRRVDRWCAPLWTAFHAASVWASIGVRRLWWSGILYEIGGRTRTRVLRRLDRET